MFLCHRLPERSLFIRGYQLPLCARCTGILVGYICGGIYALLYGTLSWKITLLFMLPLLIDGMGQYLGLWISTNPRRLISGILAGIATDFLVYHIATLGYRHGMQLANYIGK
ncbi:MAG: DUF2085 domain-containing protein [Limnochordia bacterium]|nr:DUF2085 domain-containing protein [Limnochordia bacterium]MDD2630002.1 DUF2085 domain-containing protein [Limnochordia bacterium]MDD4517402.1 DUF2085 domain-containing protein [Limnochordia bacterium]